MSVRCPSIPTPEEDFLVNRFCSACGMVIVLERPPKSQPPRYEITGVGLRDPQNEQNEVPLLPKDGKPDTRRKKKIQIGCKCQLSFPCEEYDTPHGFFIHAVCWDMISRVAGPLAAERLDLLIESMRHLWANNYPYHPYSLNEIVDNGSFRQYFMWVGNFLSHCRSFLGTIPREQEIPIKIVAMPLTDPFHAPKLRALINRCKKVQRKQTTLKVTRSLRKRSSLQPGSQCSLSQLPLDIKQLIFDELCANLLDAANAVEAFHWRLPDGLWRKQLPLDMLVELDDILPTDYFNWRYFFIEFSRLINGSYALANRERIFKLIRTICDGVFCKLNNEDHGERGVF
ncbi:hypothetical protein FQN52_002702 [Onygenales sp. PD_12]|nr:hypothetical protein FQN53_007320 [Emmonsiellopsis sp. PD_33]KAK2778668.1 hypothetical protein FQN52_002702 [Onygenales sp. PD_12]